MRANINFNLSMNRIEIFIFLKQISVMEIFSLIFQSIFYVIEKK